MSNPHIYTTTLQNYFEWTQKAIQLQIEQEELSICEVLAWRMFGINADMFYMQGELVVLVDLNPSKYALDK